MSLELGDGVGKTDTLCFSLTGTGSTRGQWWTRGVVQRRGCPCYDLPGNPQAGAGEDPSRGGGTPFGSGRPGHGGVAPVLKVEPEGLRPVNSQDDERKGHFKSEKGGSNKVGQSRNWHWAASKR